MSEGTVPEVIDWQVVHEAFQRLARRKGELDAEEARWLVVGQRMRVHLELGFATLGEYLERMLGYTPRVAAERLRVAVSLEQLPHLMAGLEEGRLCWSAVRELVRVATPETEEAWAGAVVNKTVRQVEELVSGRLPGDLPGDRPRPEARTHRLSFEVSPETYARMREATSVLTRELGTRLDDDALLMHLANLVLTGGGAARADEGRAAYQVAITICESCRRVWNDGGGRPVEVDEVSLEMAACDGQCIGNVYGPQPADGSAGVRVGQTDPVDDATHVGEPDADDATHVGEPDADGATHVGDLGQDEFDSFGFADFVAAASNIGRATQTIAPAVRRQVVRRAHGRCEVPGCRLAAFCHVHHIRYRSHGGDHEPSNLVVVCESHHRLIHAGALRVSGRAPDQLSFSHADGRSYGAVRAPSPPAERPGASVTGVASRARQDAIEGLRRLGVPRAYATRAVSAAASELGPEATAEELLREGLLELGRGEYAGASTSVATGTSSATEAPLVWRGATLCQSRTTRPDGRWRVVDPRGSTRAGAAALGTSRC